MDAGAMERASQIASEVNRPYDSQEKLREATQLYDSHIDTSHVRIRDDALLADLTERPVFESDGLPAACLELLAALRDCSNVARVKAMLLHGGYTGALVLLITPFRSDGRELPSFITKFDGRSEIEGEVRVTKVYGPPWGPTHPRVLDVQFAGANGIMQIELCGGRLGIPGLTREAPVETFASFLGRFISGDAPEAAMSQAIVQLGTKLKAWSKIRPATLDLFVEYRSEENISKRVIGAPECQDVIFLNFGLDYTGALQNFFKQFLDFFSEEANRPSIDTHAGISHGDFHGGNQLLDSHGNVWLIDFATARDCRHSLDDFCKLLVSSLILYTEANSTDEPGFEILCQKLAVVPDLSAAFPCATNVSPTIARLEAIVKAMWPSICAMDPAGSGQAFVWALLRYGVRFAGYPQLTAGQKRRSLFLATTCAMRLYFGIGSCGKLLSSRSCFGDIADQWQASELLNAHRGGRAALVGPAGTSGILSAYAAQIASQEAWQVDPISRVKLSVDETCIHVATEFLPAKGGATRVLRDPVSEAAAAHLAAPFAGIFPRGLPARTLVVGSGGTGKTVLTRQISVEACRVFLNLGLPLLLKGERVNAFLPLRLSLQSAPGFLDVSRGFSVLVAYFEQIFGKESSQARMPEIAMASGVPMLLLLDGLDEAQQERDRVLVWILELAALPHVYIVLTSRDAGVDGARGKLGEAGFEARRMQGLSSGSQSELLQRLMAQLDVAEAERSALVAEVARPEYRSLAETPLTLSLLAQVLLRRGHAKEGLTRSKVYEYAVQMVCQVNAAKSTRGSNLSTALETSERSLQLIAFANHESRKRSQSWELLAEAGLQVDAVRELVALGSMPLLEVVAGRVQFTHLSYQEYLAAEVVARLVSKDAARHKAWLRTCAGEAWWTEVLLMAIEMLTPDQRSALLDAFTENRCAHGWVNTSHD